METAQDTKLPSEAVLERIDAILRELLELRQALAAQGRVTRGNMTAELFGALGHGTWEEYDLDFDWRQFEA
ncbi:MAG: hypothetical protein ACUVXG_11865 [Anaerolineae bacterium]